MDTSVFYKKQSYLCFRFEIILKVMFLQVQFEVDMHCVEQVIQQFLFHSVCLHARESFNWTTVLVPDYKRRGRADLLTD